MRRVYEVSDGDRPRRESVHWSEASGKLQMRAHRAVSDSEGWAWEIEASAEGELLSLRWRREGLPAAQASFRWEADAWVGMLETASGASEAVWPMTQGLQPVFPAAVSDFLLLRRLRLPEGSQRRVETLTVAPGSLEGRPAHLMVDRLSAGAYRITDEDGRGARLEVDAEGWPVERRAEDGRAFRLLEAVAA